MCFLEFQTANIYNAWNNLIYLSAFSHHRAFEAMLTAASVKNALMGEDASASIISSQGDHQK